MVENRDRIVPFSFFDGSFASHGFGLRNLLDFQGGEEAMQKAVAGAALVARKVDSACAIAMTRMGEMARGFVSSVEAFVEDSCTADTLLQVGLKYCKVHDGGNALMSHFQSGGCGVGPAAIGSCNIDFDFSNPFDVPHVLAMQSSMPFSWCATPSTLGTLVLYSTLRLS